MAAARKRYSSLRLVMVGAVVTVFVLAYLDLRREQARALDDFTAEQSLLARTIAATMHARLELVRADLESALDGADDARQRIVERRDGAYRALDILAPDAPRHYRWSGAPADLPDAGLDAARVALGAQLNTEHVVASVAVARDPAQPQQLRFFGLREGTRSAMLVADVDRLFAGARPSIQTSDAPMRWLLVDDTGRDIALSAATEKEAGPRIGELSASTELEPLYTSLRQGAEGTMLVSRPGADSLGLGARLAVAGFSTVPLGGGRRWGVAVVTSARRVRDRARLTTWRLGITTAVVSLLVALFGAAIGRQQRREQQLAEALTLAEATGALRERSEKMIEVLPVGVLALDQDQNVVSANPYLLARGVLAGRRLGQALPYASAAELASLEALIVEAKAVGRPQECIGTALHLAAGERRDIDAYAIPLARSLSDVDCFLVVHDRTQIRSLERSLVRAEKLATIGTLAAGVAHEMGTPLGIISGRAEQLLSRLPDGDSAEPARKNIASILSQVDKVSMTIRQLLDFARVRPIATEAITPALAVEGAAALLDHHFRMARVSLEVDIPPAVPTVAADPGQLEQVLVNLLMNACDACGASGHVWVRAHAADDRVAIEISDDGAGIAAEHLPMVLDPFFTTKKRGQGTGLGLTIVADIVKNHRGSLELESTPGEGTTVRVSLPRAS